MLKEERKSVILREVNLHNKVLSSDLCELLKVSEDTIRRDLLELEKEKKIIRVHGGALSKSFYLSLHSNSVYSLDGKQEIARKAISFLKNDMVVLSTGGTTIIEFAKIIPEELHATFITVSLPVAIEYTRHESIDVIFIGDKISKSSLISVGAHAVEQIRKIKADLCFVGVNALDIEHGLTDNDWEIVQIKKEIIKSSDKVIAPVITEKLDTHQRFKVCDIEEIDIIITEKDNQDPFFDKYKKIGVNIV
ncbi:DeoR/GlpR family DNA-binding transcription regulator [Melioribacteraceae bacterium 4301-Me]|uniref:DeoR/GlpR family DNA-binding transcription regulator n=1 Tax=Pyranulibacter aquaticus TaxID=3163344 RepID=UPI003599368A